MFSVGNPPSEEVIFAFQMMMIRYHLTPADVMRILVALDKEKAPR